MVWNAYNRAVIDYVIASQPDALEPVKSPHFTYHPALIFQFKDDKSPPHKFLFRGIADVGITLMQEQEMPWIRAISEVIEKLPSGGRRQDDIEVEEIGIAAPDETVSVRMAIDFIQQDDVREQPPSGEWHYPWDAVAIRLKLDLCPGQIATLSWFHFH